MSGHSKWANIKHKKEKTDSARAKIFTKIGKELTIAVREGGPDPASNSKLRDLIQKAKANNVPNDNIERTIKKAQGAQGDNFEEVTYEGYGPAGVAVIVTATENLPKKDLWAEEIQKALPEVVSLYHDVQNKKRNVILGPEIHHIWGRKTLTASLCGIAFEVSPFSFFQVHKAQAEVLYQKALDAADLKGGETVIDAYCGTGTISLCLAKKARRVIGIEIVREAIEDAKKNAAFNHIENAEFHAADAGLLMPKLYEEGLRPDVIVMDPVRAGCSEDVLKAAAGMQPARIVYVSCNPATFARDAEILSRLGYYKLQSVQPVDMFPQTTHVECVCLMSRVDK